jgi:DNA-binding winged helix-turn-helix (wHTH) protein
VHVRRLRAKLGTDHEQLIGTVRNVGYRFVTRPERSERSATANTAAADAGHGTGGNGAPSGSEAAEADDADAQAAGMVATPAAAAR